MAGVRALKQRPPTPELTCRPQRTPRHKWMAQFCENCPRLKPRSAVRCSDLLDVHVLSSLGVRGMLEMPGIVVPLQLPMPVALLPHGQ